MEIRQLRYFAAVARESSFSKASKKLNIAQPAISRQIQMLEEEVGVQLLWRTAHGVQMTDPGRQLKEMAEYILNYINDIRSTLNRSAVEPSGAVVVGIPPMLGILITSKLIEIVASRFPKVKLHVVEGLSVFLGQWLELSKLDLAVLTDCGSIPGVERHDLAVEDLVLVGTPSLLKKFKQPIPLSALVNIRLITTNAIQKLIEPWLVSKNIEVDFEMELDSVPVVMELISGGRYCSVLPFSLVHAAVESGSLAIVPFKDDNMKRRIVTAVNANRESSFTFSAIEELLIELVQQLPLRVN